MVGESRDGFYRSSSASSSVSATSGAPENSSLSFDTFEDCVHELVKSSDIYVVFTYHERFHLRFCIGSRFWLDTKVRENHDVGRAGRFSSEPIVLLLKLCDVLLMQPSRSLSVKNTPSSFSD